MSKKVYSMNSMDRIFSYPGEKEEIYNMHKVKLKRDSLRSRRKKRRKKTHRK